MANLVNIRIDERMIHGQVGAFWTNTIKATRIMVVDDDAATNEITKTALKMGKPSGTKLSILSVQRAYERLSDPTAYQGERVFLIFKTIKSLKRIVEMGLDINDITVGNISSKNGSTRIINTVSVTPEEIADFQYCQEKLNRNFYYQAVPSDERKEFGKILEDFLTSQAKK